MPSTIRPNMALLLGVMACNPPNPHDDATPSNDDDSAGDDSASIADDSGTVTDDSGTVSDDSGTVGDDSGDSATDPDPITEVAARLHADFESLVYVSWQQNTEAQAWVEYSFDEDAWSATPSADAAVGIRRAVGPRRALRDRRPVPRLHRHDDGSAMHRRVVHPDRRPPGRTSRARGRARTS